MARGKITVVDEKDQRSITSQSSRDVLKRIYNYMRRDRLPFGMAIFLTALGTVAAVLAPWVLGLATTSIYESVSQGMSVDFGYLGKLVLIVGALYLGSALSYFIRSRLLVKVTNNFIFQLREELSHKITKLPLSYLDQHSVGDMLSRMTNDMDTIGDTLRQNIIQIVSSIVTIVGVIAMMFYIDVKLSLIPLIGLPFSGLITARMAKKGQTHFRNKSKNLGELDGYVEEVISSQEVVKSYTFEDQARFEFDEINQKLYKASFKAQWVSGLIMPLTGFISNLIYVFIAGFGGYFVLTGRIAIGSIQAFIQYARRLNQPITQMAEVVGTLQSTIAAAERIFKVLDQPEEPPVLKPVPMPQEVGHVQFDHISFGYDPGQMIIKDFNLDVQNGETIAIVGPTGAGKTTLINLLLRFYDVDEGAIYLDGVDIRDMSRSDLRDNLGMVLQDTWLYTDTICNNIAYGNPSASMEEIVAAAKATYCDNFIRTLPEGYDTVIHEDGSSLSQGQRQLLTIARALVSDPNILILDEATSSVDTRTEKLIQKAMDRLMAGRTNFVIAHRLSTIVGADRILVLQDGSIVEQGSHEELIAQRGFYYELYNTQFDQSA